MTCKTTIRLTTLVACLVVAGSAAAEPTYSVENQAQGGALVANSPSSPESYLEYANFLSASGDDPGATVILERGRVAADPSVTLLVALGRSYQREQKWSRAETAAREALVIDDKHADAHVLLGEIYFALDWQQSGLESYRRAVELEPEAVLPQVRLVGGLLDSGQVKEAENRCLQFISGGTESAELWLALGRVFEKQDKHREAFTTYGQVLTIDPENGQAFARQGKLFCEFGQYAAAEESCRRALDLDPEQSLAHAYLGISLSYQGKNKEARSHALIAESAGLDMTSVWKRMDR
ncbi:MAG: tetratricopeptide repeat protein [bacterium]|nr:tetratricopeptide repeat protein [bacterium]